MRVATPVHSCEAPQRRTCIARIGVRLRSMPLIIDVGTEA